MTDIELEVSDDQNERPVPLVVDLDGALLGTDLLVESCFLLAKRNPLRLLQIPLWLAQSPAALKRHLAHEAMPDVQTLPYHAELLAHLDAEKSRRRPLILITGANEEVARAVADKLGFFDRIFASDGTTNLSDDRKRERLVAEFGERGFDYAGHSGRDSPVWAAARRAILVGPEATLRGAAAGTTSVERVFQDGRFRPLAALRALRPHQWLKNALVFLPVAAAHQLYATGPLAQAMLAFVAFSLCASSVYLFNDLLDLPSDRRHPQKKHRALASGQLPMMHAIAMMPLLLLAAGAVALTLPLHFLAVLGFYWVLMLAYSLGLKDLPIMDVLVLAGGYALRVFAGAVAVSIVPSPWLLAFCIFLFLSLALIKRYAELATMRSIDGEKGRARAYLMEDSNLLAAFGSASGYLAVVVLALYMNAEPVLRAHDHYEFIWLLCILLLYWISYMWLAAHRGRIHDDPLLFALKDRMSRILIALMAATLLIVT
jgi:4-hydroxybenzoate polyprenyltransferase/phosphoserine phosphatase